ncbi:MAG: NifB/NifX family molybdenum-iron cluster-binding protein [Candidatus Krumholzibacteriota bacterium]|nr:NifB/NifX family molybdenum-iron cluster-binding protein [Candidatus Krumholzibacteriota bacterium]
MEGKRVIAVPTLDEQGLDGEVSSHFGPASHFTFIELEGDRVVECRVMANPFAGSHQPGQVPTFVKEQGATVMLAGGMGGRAIALLQGFGIDVATGAAGTVKEALEAYLRGELQGSAPCRDDDPGCH